MYLPRARMFAPTRQAGRMGTTTPVLVRKPTTFFLSSNGAQENAACEKTLATGSFSSEMEVKKSRFIGYAKHVKTWDDAHVYIEEIKAEHPKARHWCYGFRSGANPVNERCSDDGEPTGTAGTPILSAIRGEDLSDTVCVVVRYFGGIKLGAGGLIRSYGAAARQVLRESPVEILIPMSSTRIKVDSSHVGSLYELVGKYSASTSREDYLMDGSIEVTITCEASNMDAFCTGLTDATRGEAVFDRDAKTTGA
eukprot:scaffold23896_cov170-Amphora_coffeaeformis.AAC.3